MNKINNTTLKELKYLTETDPNTGKFVNANKVGRNVMIGLAIILVGILYAIGGITAIIVGFLTIFGFLLFAAVALYIIAMVS